jgi:hypothetical protein
VVFAPARGHPGDQAGSAGPEDGREGRNVAGQPAAAADGVLYGLALQAAPGRQEGLEPVESVEPVDFSM